MILVSGQILTFLLHFYELALNLIGLFGALLIVKLRVIFRYPINFHFKFVSYKKGALVADSSERIHKHDISGSGAASREYVPTGKPGSRLPHMHVKPLTEVSTEVLLFLMKLLFIKQFAWWFEGKEIPN
jgi:hypothetical protein